MSINGESIVRPNQGGYYITNEYGSTEIEPCERKGVLLAKRIGHRISHKIVPKSGGNKRANRLYTAEKDGVVVTDELQELTDKVFEKVDVEAVRRAIKFNRLLQGWSVRVEA